MYGASKFRAWLQHPGYHKKDSEAPDYSQLAQASKESAEIMSALGREQLDFTKQQYAENKPILQEIALSNRSYAAETYLPDMLTLCASQTDAAVVSLCGVQPVTGSLALMTTSSPGHARNRTGSAWLRPPARLSRAWWCASIRRGPAN